VLDRVDESARRAFDEALRSGEVSLLPPLDWNVLYLVIAREYPSLVSLLDWLIAQVDRPTLRNDLPLIGLGRSWTAFVLSSGWRTFPCPPFAAWRRPQSPDAPYLAGLLPDL
jgi:hypothetical protein